MGVLIVEETLIVKTATERRAFVFHVGGAAITETITIGQSVYCRECRAVGLHIHGVHGDIGIQYAHGVELIAQAQTTHSERCLQVIVGSQNLGGTVILNLFHLCRCVARLVVTGHHVDAV